VSPDLDSQLQADIMSFINSASLAELVSIVTAPEEWTTVTFGNELLSNLNPETDKLEAVNITGVVVSLLKILSWFLSIKSSKILL